MSENKLSLSVPIVEKTIDAVRDAISTIFGPAAKEVGEGLADWVRARRFNNQAKILGKVQEKIKDEGIDPRQVNLKVLVPLLDGISLEEDPELQTLWENLTLNYVDPNVVMQSTVYPEILRQMSSEDVRILKAVMANRNTFDYNKLKPSKDSPRPDLSNLVRLGLLHEKPQYNVYQKTPSSIREEDPPKYALEENDVDWDTSEFYDGFVKAISR